MQKDTQKTEILTFQLFIREFFPQYEIDEYNSGIIQKLNYWANRDDKNFNSKEPGWHIDKGILFSGNVGTGKTDLMKLLRNYLGYRHSPYLFDLKTVWRFAEVFQKDGYSGFDSEETGNRCYDELALFEGGQGVPLREYCSHFGNKILIGSELIMMRYEVFKQTAYQSHFTTNATTEDLERIYGERAYSRLFEMCNIINYIGVDRRQKASFKPLFTNNKNKPTAPRSRELTQDEIDENKMKLEMDYELFCQTGEMPETAVFDFDLLVVNGVSVATNEELKLLMEAVSLTKDCQEATLLEKPTQREERNKTYVWKRAREMAVQTLYQRLKDSGAKSIFGIIDASKTISSVVEKVTEDKTTNL